MAVLLDAVKGIGLIEFDISKTSIGPPTAKKLAEVLSDPTPFTASIASIRLSGNMITGSSEKGYTGSGDWDYDSDLSGIIALGEAAAVSKTLTSIDLSKCGIAAVGIAEVTKFISAGSSLTSLRCGSNPIKDEDVATLRAAAPNGCEVVW